MSGTVHLHDSCDSEHSLPRLCVRVAGPSPQIHVVLLKSGFCPYMAMGHVSASSYVIHSRVRTYDSLARPGLLHPGGILRSTSSHTANLTQELETVLPAVSLM